MIRDTAAHVRQYPDELTDQALQRLYPLVFDEWCTVCEEINESNTGVEPSIEDETRRYSLSVMIDKILGTLKERDPDLDAAEIYNVSPSLDTPFASFVNVQDLTEKALYSHLHGTLIDVWVTDAAWQELATRDNPKPWTPEELFDQMNDEFRAGVMEMELDNRGCTKHRDLSVNPGEW